MFVIVTAHTITDPEAVVIVSLYAHLTLSTVPSAVVTANLANITNDFFGFIAGDQLI